MQVQIAGVLGTTEVNGTWTVTTVPTPTTFTVGVTATNAYVSGGTVVQALYVNQIASFVSADQAWEWTLPGQAQLDSLVAQWSATVGGVTYSHNAEVDVVGGRLADPWLMRQTDPDVAAVMASALGKQALLILLDQVEEGIRDIIGYPPVLEGFRVSWDELRGTLNDALYVSGTVNGLPYGWGAGRMMIPGIKFPTPARSTAWRWTPSRTFRTCSCRRAASSGATTGRGSRAATRCGAPMAGVPTRAERRTATSGGRPASSSTTTR
jgi:hypothetical protein